MCRSCLSTLISVGLDWFQFDLIFPVVLHARLHRIRTSLNVTTSPQDVVVSFCHRHLFYYTVASILLSTYVVIDCFSRRHRTHFFFSAEVLRLKHFLSILPLCTLKGVSLVFSLWSYHNYLYLLTVSGKLPHFHHQCNVQVL